MNRTIILIVFMITKTLFFSQRTWDKGPLTWSDFTEKNYAITEAYSSELGYFIGYKTSQIKRHDTIIDYLKSYCFIDTASTYVNRQFKTDMLLLYNQVVFDLVELNKRQLQNKMFTVHSAVEAEQYLSLTLQNCSSEISVFKTESKHGNDTLVIREWARKLDKKLSSEGPFNFPNLVLNRFGYGMHLGIGSTAFTGNLASHLRTAIGFVYGFNFSYDKLNFFLEGNLSGSKVKLPFQGKMKWDKGLKTNLTLIDLAVGPNVFENSKYKIVPFLGLAVIELSRETDNNLDVETFVNYNFTFGLACDFKLKTRYKLNQPSVLLKRNEFSQTQLRARFFVSPVNYGSDLKGLTINFSLLFSIFGRLIN